MPAEVEGAMGRISEIIDELIEWLIDPEGTMKDLAVIKSALSSAMPSIARGEKP
jgi:hypothetical protein